jgi:hypothetical protein
VNTRPGAYEIPNVYLALWLARKNKKKETK